MIILLYRLFSGQLMYTRGYIWIQYVYIDYHQFPHDTNLTLNTLLQVLQKNKERLGRYLHVQLDNCA